MLHSAYIQISKRCNLRCQHCFNEASPGASPVFDPARAGEVADQLHELDCRVAVVTGGEPTLHPEIVCVLGAALFDRGIVPILYSNMYKVPNEVLSEIRDSGFFIIHTSIDSPDANEHDNFRGPHGAFEETLSSARRAMEMGFEVWVRMTLTKFNFKKVACMAELAAAEGFRSLRVRPMVPVGRADRGLCINSQQLEEAVRRLLAWRNSYDGPMDVTFLPTCFEFLIEPTEEVRAVPCFVAKAFISSSGNVQGCNYFTPVIGNLFETPLRVMWPRYSREMCEAIRPASRCADCEVWSKCHGGCKANNAAYGLALTEPDPLCFKTPEAS